MNCEYSGCKNGATKRLTGSHNTLCVCDHHTPAWANGEETDAQRRLRERGVVLKNNYTVEAIR